MAPRRTTTSARRPGASESSLDCQERGDQPRPPTQHQLDGGVVKVDAVLERADAGLHRIADTGRGLGMRPHPAPGSRGLGSAT